MKIKPQPQDRFSVKRAHYRPFKLYLKIHQASLHVPAQSKYVLIAIYLQCALTVQYSTVQYSTVWLICGIHLSLPFACVTDRCVRCLFGAASAGAHYYLCFEINCFLFNFRFAVGVIALAWTVSFPNCKLSFRSVSYNSLYIYIYLFCL